MNCPLCQNSNIRELEIIDKNNLIELYKKYTDISFLLNQNLIYCECQNCKLKYFSPLIIGNEKFYNSLQKFDWYYLKNKKEYEVAKKYISSSDKVLEVGSGKGEFAKYLPTNEYVGLDFSKRAKDMANSNGVKIENELIENYSKKHQKKFDVVVSFQVLEHISNPKSFIKAKIESIKKNGKMIIAIPSEDSFLRYVTNGILNMPPHHVTRWSDITLEYIAKEFNLELISIYHEKVQKIHKRWFYSTMFQKKLLKNEIIDISLTRKFVSKFSNLFSIFLAKVLKDESLPNGHTVIAVYRKK